MIGEWCMKLDLICYINIVRLLLLFTTILSGLTTSMAQDWHFIGGQLVITAPLEVQFFSGGTPLSTLTIPPTASFPYT